MNPNQYRYERKWLCAAHRSIAQFWLVTSDLRCFSEYPDRRVNNIYFDTPDLSLYQASIAGDSNRTKVRVRWYGHSTHADCFLELKTKRGAVGTKEQFPLGGLDVGLWSDPLLRMRLLENAQVPAAVRQFFRLLRPMLYNCYERSYLRALAFGGGPNCRVTIDSNVAFARGQSTSRVFALRGTSIVEMKYGAAYCPSWNLHEVPLRVMSVSKYVTGVRTLFW